MWMASYPPWQQCRLMCPHLLEVCCTAGKPPHDETCTKYSTIARGMPHEGCIQSDEMRDFHTHQYLHRCTCTNTFVLTKMHKIHLHLHTHTHHPCPPHLTTAHSCPPTVTLCVLPTSKLRPDRVKTVPPAAIPVMGLTAVMARSSKENSWTDWAVLVAPVASLNLSWTGPVTGPPAGLVVQDSLRTYEEGSKQYWNEFEQCQ